ncbi:MAG: hypothetical protein ABEI98_07130 [Halorhabdus sp.]
MSDDTRREEAEYADWELPGQRDPGQDDEDGGVPDDEPDEAERTGPPPEWRGELLRDRIRERLSVSPQQWYVIETFLLVLPYPLFVLVYLSVPVNETLFLLVTLAYSLVAIYVGFLS